MKALWPLFYWRILTFAAIAILLLLTNVSVHTLSASPLSFHVGTGFNDNIVHQLVRADNDRLYIFAGQAQYSSVIQAYWTNTPGLPTSSSSFDGKASLTETATIISTEVVYG